MTPPTKPCTSCRIPKPLTAFNKQSEAADGRRTKCKECEKKEHEQAKKEKEEYSKKYFTF